MELIQRMLEPKPAQRPEISEIGTLVSRWKVLQNFGAHAQHSEQFLIVVTYRSEIQPQMLQIVAALREFFGDRAVVHGLSDISQMAVDDDSLSVLLIIVFAVCEPGRYWADLYFEWMKHAAIILQIHSENYFSSPACRDEFESAVTEHVPDTSDPCRIVIPLVVQLLCLTPQKS